MNEPYEGGTSSDLMTGYVRQQVRAIQPARVVDFGAGLGKMGRICRDELGDGVEVIAVEGCTANAESLRQGGIYNRVDTALLQDWIAGNDEQFDLAIFGDVLEHLTRRQALAALNATLERFEHVIVNVPLRNLHQDGHDDNPLEAHRAYFTEACFDTRFQVREKHVATPTPGYTKLNAWIVGRKKFRLKTAIKGHLLRRFGRPAKAALEKLGYDSYVNN